MMAWSIGRAARALGLKPDTLRYYDRIGLVCPRQRGANGRRYYDERDLERLRFVRRAQAMDYRLDEIARLLRFRDNPNAGREGVRAMASEKLSQIESRLAELTQLRNEFRLLLNLCGQAQEGCPIIAQLDRPAGGGEDTRTADRPRR